MTKKSLIFSLLLSLLLASALAVPAAAQGKHAAVIKINDVITPAIAEFVSRSIEQATKENAACLIIQMDTPGGLDLSMRDIIKDIMNAEIPVIVYVGPSGARAASAGAIITIAADIAAMAPSTNIGAAHPVAMGGGKMDRTMAEKVVNDAVAYVKSIAQKKGRNVDWAVRAVRDSVSIPETEALKLKVIDLIAKDLDELLEKADGKTVEKPKGAIKLATKGLKIQELEMGFRQRFLATLSNPNLAYILMMIGMVGLYFELAHPGAIFPGVIGGISLILAFFAFRTLPVNYAGVLLILFAVALFIAEIKVVSHGILTIGGIVSLVMGSLLLFNSPDPALRVSLKVMIPALIVISLFFAGVMSLVMKAQMRKRQAGREGMIGAEGEAVTDIHEMGKVFVHGEYWNAWSDRAVEKGKKIRVVEVAALKLKIEEL